MRLRRSAALWGSVLGMSLASAGFARGADSPCGSAVIVRPGDTLSRIAARCDTNESALLRANPGVQGSEDLRVGMPLAMPKPNGVAGAAHQAAARLRSYAAEAGDTVESIAKKFGASVEDLIKANPELHQGLVTLGQRLNIPGVGGGPSLSISPESGPPGTFVTLSAIGLPVDAPVEIDGGPPGAAQQVLDRARASNDGTLQATVRVPDQPASDRFVFRLQSPENGLALRSAPFRITAAKP